MSDVIKLTDTLKVPTAHNEAKNGDFAPTVIMPGDPLRAKLIAEDYLDNSRLVNNVRGIQGYTGTYKGKPISVMASGMGQPSMGIYSYELYSAYDVKNIIRIGSMGSYQPNLHLGDMVMAVATCTDSNFSSQYGLDGPFAPSCDMKLALLAAKYMHDNNIPCITGSVVSSDRFYSPTDDFQPWQKMNVLGAEMETAALYCNAAYLTNQQKNVKRALGLFTVSNSFIYKDEDMTSEERQNSMDPMIKTALNVAYEADKIPDKYTRDILDILDFNQK